MSNPNDIEAYEKWRATVPFTQEQIALVFDRQVETYAHIPDTAERLKGMAAWVRTGKLSRKVLNYALDFLVTHCCIKECGRCAGGCSKDCDKGCGRKAFYRVGYFGYCTQHQDRALHVRRAIVQQLDAKSARYEVVNDAIDRVQRLKDAHSRSKKTVGNR